MRTLTVMTVAAFALTACATPQTYLKNIKTGEVKYCGGDVSSSASLGFIGYQIQKSTDRKCVETLQANGYKIIQSEEK